MGAIIALQKDTSVNKSKQGISTQNGISTQQAKKGIATHKLFLDEKTYNF